MVSNGGDIPNFYSLEWSTDNATWTVLNAGDPWELNYTQVYGSVFPFPYVLYRV